MIVETEEKTVTTKWFKGEFVIVSVTTSENHGGTMITSNEFGRGTNTMNLDDLYGLKTGLVDSLAAVVAAIGCAEGTDDC